MAVRPYTASGIARQSTITALYMAPTFHVHELSFSLRFGSYKFCLYMLRSRHECSHYSVLSETSALFFSADQLKGNTETVHTIVVLGH